MGDHVSPNPGSGAEALGRPMSALHDRVSCLAAESP